MVTVIIRLQGQMSKIRGCPWNLYGLISLLLLPTLWRFMVKSDHQIPGTDLEDLNLSLEIVPFSRLLDHQYWHSTDSN